METSSPNISIKVICTANISAQPSSRRSLVLMDVTPTQLRQYNPAMASTTLFDGMYYELTYNGNKGELYVDAYKKWENFMVVV